jgi:hypothetical protein
VTKIAAWNVDQMLLLAMVNAHAVLDIILMETLAHLVAPYVLSALAQAAMLAWEMLVMLVELVNAVMDSLHQEINA